MRNNASPTSTWFGGIELVASDDVLTNERTITIRVKHVIKMRMPGATENTVKSKKKTDRCADVSCTAGIK
ncbi:hypothetical protein BsIDN1_29850 [Bacillus safensis]|uniref:Uncharacterized protein n=1 Tax=Bacillus safensis TaxID=561879 RepID=A0A5S9M797_BACIA|nr:hypothetical protein BsIDN1_29850 [Bacillus safensis]